MSSTFVSFAQNFEDVMLWRALRNVELGFYIDVGAYSPMEHSVTEAFYERGWRGVNIEPHPGFHQAFLLARPRDINLKVAVGDRTADRAIYLVDETGLSTLDESQAQERVREGRTVVAEQVHVETLASIWAAHVVPDQPVHFLKVDVEGFEREVLLGNDWKLCRPWIVVVEATVPMTTVPSFLTWEEILTGNGYAHVYKDGLNRFYVANEHEDLTKAFEFPPNVFDEFVRTSERESAERAWRAETALSRIYASRWWRWSRSIRATVEFARRAISIPVHKPRGDRRAIKERIVGAALKVFQTMRSNSTLARRAALVSAIPAMRAMDRRLERASRRRGWTPWYGLSDLSPRAQHIYCNLKNPDVPKNADVLGSADHD